MIFTRRSAPSSTSTHPAISGDSTHTREKSVRTILITSSARAGDSEPEPVVIFDFDQPTIFGEQERRSARHASGPTHHNSGVRGVPSVPPAAPKSSKTASTTRPEAAQRHIGRASPGTSRSEKRRSCTGSGNAFCDDVDRALELISASSKPRVTDRASTGSAVSFPSLAVQASRCMGGERLSYRDKSG
jgi:hypothetical protein